MSGLLFVIFARIKGIKRREKTALAQHTSRVNSKAQADLPLLLLRRQISEGYEEYTQLELELQLQLTAVGPVNCESVEKENLQIDVDVDTTLLWGWYEPAEPGADPSSKTTTLLSVSVCSTLICILSVLPSERPQHRGVF